MGSDECEWALIRSLSSGGDARISLGAQTGLNKYLSGPYPRDVIAYSSSTVSDISSAAFAHLLRLEAADTPARYAQALEALAKRIKRAYLIDENARVVFAASGTDLEYVALAAVMGKAQGGVHNILLGADEIGSGCIYSANGAYFANETALGVAVEPASPVAGCGPVSMVDVPVRCGEGVAQSSDAIAASMRAEIMAAVRASKHALVHGVHGSKTGLVLPSLDHIDTLQAEFEGNVTFVIDACQARITGPALSEYLQRGCIVLLTGSKFMGAPPFSGFAIVPEQLALESASLPAGFADIFNRAEWPKEWPGREQLPDGANASLVHRIEAAVFELERFQQLPLETIGELLDLFETTLEAEVIGRLGVKRVLPHAPGSATRLTERPIEMRTLTTLDVSMLPGLATFDDAQVLHRRMAMEGGIRLGQPVKCVRLEHGWGGTLRIGLSMPMMVQFAEHGGEAAAVRMRSDFSAIADWLLQEASHGA